MKNEAKNIIITKNKEEKVKKQLLTVIKKKRFILKQLVIKVETLKVNLEMAKQEYMVKVGMLFIKDNQLDLEIIRLKNIIKLLDEGMSYEEAIKSLSETYYAQQLEFEKEKEKVKEEEKVVLKREEKKEEDDKSIKKLWKKLIAKFHPDLVQDKDEKKERDAIMKRINKAYQEMDYDQLIKLDQEHMEDAETTIDNLEDILYRIMKDIEANAKLFNDLKQSEWHEWMIKIEKAKKKKKNIFADTERKLLDDIVLKFDLIKLLKSQILEKDKTVKVL